MIRAHEEVLAGLPNEAPRLDEARESADFYRGRFDAYADREPGIWREPDLPRESRIMTWLVNTLATHLYATGPTRTLPDHPAAAQWLNGIYQAGQLDALMQAADKWATVGEVAAIQVIPTEDPARPIRHALWPADQLVVWESDGDPLTPEAVAVIDRFDNRRRLRLWTPFWYREYATDKLGSAQTAGGTAYRPTSDPEPNPFGVIPFAFVHYEYPATEFWSGCPGRAFRVLNRYINKSLTDSGEGIEYCGKPVILATGVRAGWRPNTPVRPGDIWDLPPEGVDAAGNGIPPDVRPLQFDLGFVDVQWADLQSYIDHTLQCADVPIAAFRMVESSARSGVSIVAEQLALVRRAEARQRPFARYELDLARVTLQVGAAHLGHNGLATAGQLAAAALDPGLTLRWPEMGGRIPDPQRDAEDQWRLENRLASRTQILMEREGFNREEAEAHLAEVAADLAREAALLGSGPGPAEPAPTTPPNPAGPAGDPQPDPATEA